MMTRRTLLALSAVAACSPAVVGDALAWAPTVIWKEYVAPDGEAELLVHVKVVSPGARASGRAFADDPDGLLWSTARVFRFADFRPLEPERVRRLARRMLDTALSERPWESLARDEAWLRADGERAVQIRREVEGRR